VGCSRFKDFYHPHKHFQNGLHLDPEVLFKGLQETPDLHFILFCGNYGDPIFHPELHSIIQRIRLEYPNLRVLMHTNAAAHSMNYWQKLASLFSQNNSYVKFSIDGLKKGHELFRRGTQWEKAIENAQSFIDAGGNAIWQMIEFDHNRHEAQACKDLAEEMGFKKFQLRRNNYPGLDQHIQTAPNASSISNQGAEKSTSAELVSWHQSHLAQSQTTRIDCKAKSRNNLYLDVHGHVWPCCWVGGLPYRPEDSLREHFKQAFVAENTLDDLSLEKHPLSKILSGPIFTAIDSGISNKSFSTCSRTCGIREIR
jgi:hypothetical protein